jgi:exopolysaccharide production protein ExoY
LPTHQVSQASDPRLPKMSARAVAARPHLVSSDRWIQRDTEGDVGMPAEAIRERLPRLIRVLNQDISLRESRSDALGVVRSWSVHATVKRSFDILGALLLGVALTPLMVVVVLLLRAEGGPVIYRHRRVGRDGRVFECLKFRSMVPDADRVLRQLLDTQPELKAEWLRDHKLRHDPRITLMGRFLRRTSLDELPQIWNVVRGDMSLVGPRPVVREELMRYGRCLPIYLSAKPGITGLWQVTGRNNTDYRRRVALDVYYVRKQNLLLDLFILIKTMGVVLGGGGAY